MPLHQAMPPLQEALIAPPPVAARAVPELAGLGPDWVLVAGARLGADPIDMVLLHPRLGVALLQVAPRWTIDAPGRLRQRLDQARFGAIFNGHLPVVHRMVTPRDLPDLPRLLAEGFAGQPPLDLPAGDAWMRVVHRALLTGPMAMSEPRARRLRAAGRRKIRMAAGLGLAGVVAIATILVRTGGSAGPEPRRVLAVAITAADAAGVPQAGMPELPMMAAPAPAEELVAEPMPASEATGIMLAAQAVQAASPESWAAAPETLAAEPEALPDPPSVPVPIAPPADPQPLPVADLVPDAIPAPMPLLALAALVPTASPSPPAAPVLPPVAPPLASLPPAAPPLAHPLAMVPEAAPERLPAAPAIVAPPPAPARRAVADPAVLAALLRRGEALLALGDISGARRFFERVAEAGSAGGALAMGRTYDPVVLAELQAWSIGPDPVAAAGWYRRARELEAMAMTETQR